MTRLRRHDLRFTFHPEGRRGDVVAGPQLKNIGFAANVCTARGGFGTPLFPRLANGSGARMNHSHHRGPPPSAMADNSISHFNSLWINKTNLLGPISRIKPITPVWHSISSNHIQWIFNWTSNYLKYVPIHYANTNGIHSDGRVNVMSFCEVLFYTSINTDRYDKNFEQHAKERVTE